MKKPGTNCNSIHDSLIKEANQLIIEAERKFGPRDTSWELSKVSIWEKSPELIPYPPFKKAEIKLGSQCDKNKVERLFQLSHEVCHFLYPSTREDVNILEEGISTYFSLYCLKVRQKKKYKEYLNNLEIEYPMYFLAYRLVKGLIEKDNKMIINIRKKHPHVSSITPVHLENFSIPNSTAIKLCEKFNVKQPSF